MKILFTRHGESLANTLHIISNHDLPHPLTETGRTQAAALANVLRARADCKALRYIYASPVPRASETAQIVAAHLAEPGSTPLTPIIHPGLIEYGCGVLEGRGHAAAWQEHNRFFHDWLEGQRRDQAPTGGESFAQIRARLAEFIQELARLHGAQSEVTILCVSHGGTLRLGLPGLLNNIDFEFVQKHSLDHTEIIETEFIGGVLTCRAWGEIIFPDATG